jgi:tRNA threonylcarbamoyladenosine biosynthesis protein TsaE
VVNEYKGGRLPIYHFDTYRLKDADEFLELGPEEYFESDGLTFVEWADRVAHLLPSDRLEITFEVIGDAARQIMINGTSPTTKDLAVLVAAACHAAPSSSPGGGLAPN